MIIPKEKAHYTYVTRRILHLLQLGKLDNVVGVEVEPEYGYLTKLTYTDGSHRITYGNDLGLNNAAACDLSKDKGYTKFMLRQLGIACPDGQEFLLPWWYEKIHTPQQKRGHDEFKTADQATAYVHDSIGYPVYVKPIDGSKGSNIFKVFDDASLESVLQLYEEKRVRLAVIEQPVEMPDYRIVVLDGELISAYERIALTVVGDGINSIRTLIAIVQGQYEKEGRDTRVDPGDERIVSFLAGQGKTVDDVPKSGESVVLVPISNLSAGGTSHDVGATVHPRWVEMAASIAKHFNLRLIGLDLACQDITSADAAYCVFEVNGSPGLDHYALSGDAQKELVDELYAKVLNAFPAS